ncbi:hypothetical protein [Mariniflexile sp.]|uniref:hypothetical protein n=1 Tax=Mariniflexile sp. TaxID=1979402 RepID=UPI0035651C16
MNLKNIVHIAFLSTTLLAIGFIIAIYNTMTLIPPTANIQGKWKEVSWEYEKVDNTIFGKKINKSIKNEISKDLIIHEAEVWNFKPNGLLALNQDKKDEVLTWTLKGRGNILKLNHSSEKVEHYNIQILDEDRMVLHFSSDIQAKGIVKMIFERIKDKEYAQKT